MKTVLALLFTAVVAFAADAPEKAVLGAVEAWKQAVLKGDAAALGRIYHEGLAYTHSNGATQTKAETIAAQSSPTGIYKGVEMREVEVRVFGDTAVVRYKLDLTHFAGDTAHLHEVMVWMKTAAGWQMVVRHATRLPAPAVSKP